MKANILFVDDEEDVLEDWKLMLRPLRHSIVTATTKAEAMAHSAEHPFDLAVLDYMVGGETGLEILAAIRKRLPMIRSILVSARFEENQSEADLKKMIREKVEVDEYLHKPMKPKRFRESVTSLLEGKKEIDWKELAKKTKESREKPDSDTLETQNKLDAFLKKKK